MMRRRGLKRTRWFDFGPSFLHPEFKEYVYGYNPKAVTAVAVEAAAQH